MLSTTAKTVGIACTIAAALAVSIAPSASAKGGDGVRVAGVCSSHSTALLKVKHRDGRLEVEFEVDQNRNGVPWSVQLLRNGRLAVASARTTGAPSGSFSLERTLAAGNSPVIRARATRNGETCTATLTVRATAPAAAVATAPAPAAAASGVKLRGDGTVDDTQVAAPGPAEDHHGGNSGPGGGDDGGHHGSDD
jgi:hypothetical protein